MTTDEAGDIPTYTALVEQQRAVIDKLQRTLIDNSMGNVGYVQQLAAALNESIDRLSELRGLAAADRGRSGP